MPYRFAARNPSGIPNATANTIAASASSIVAGKRCANSYVTVRVVMMLLPKSPCAVCCR